MSRTMQRIMYPGRIKRDRARINCYTSHVTSCQGGDPARGSIYDFRDEISWDGKFIWQSSAYALRKLNPIENRQCVALMVLRDSCSWVFASSDSIYSNFVFWLSCLSSQMKRALCANRESSKEKQRRPQSTPKEKTCGQGMRHESLVTTCINSTALDKC